MCDRCALIDYPVESCWRPCYNPQQTQKSKGWIPTVPRGGFDEEDFDIQARLQMLMNVIRTQRREISGLKAKLHQDDSRDSFEGVE